MFNLLAEVDVTAQIGAVVGPTATPTGSGQAATPIPTSIPTFKPVFTPIPTFTPIQSGPTIVPEKQFRKGSFAIYGYGPVNSEVNLNGIGVSAKTTSDSQGFFVFSPIYSTSAFYPELCIQAVDKDKKTTQPSCIPAFPATNKLPSVVGPVLLSPTISLSNNKVVVGSSAHASGMTIPNAEVDIYIAKKDQRLSLVKTANAYYIPTIKTKSNDEGQFEISLPTGEISGANFQAEYKIFVSNKYGEDLSSKSNTLSFAVITSAKSLLERIIEYLIANKIRVVVLLEAMVAIILGLMALKSTTHRHKKHSEKDYDEVESHLEQLKKLS